MRLDPYQSHGYVNKPQQTSINYENKVLGTEALTGSLKVRRIISPKCRIWDQSLPEDMEWTSYKF